MTYPVSAALLSFVSGEEQHRLLHDALVGSEPLQARQDQAYAWLGVYPYLRGPNRETILERLRKSLLSVDGNAVAKLAAIMYSKVPEMSQVDLRLAVHRVLDSIDERRDLASSVQPMIQVIEDVAGPEAPSHIAEAILEIRERWV